MDNVSYYIDLLRNAIAHHDKCIFEYSNENSDTMKINKNSRVDDKDINIEITIEELQKLVEELINIFKDNPKILDNFKEEISLNNAIQNILNNNNDELNISRKSLDLSYSFYISQLFEMAKYGPPTSLKKQIRKILVNSEEFKNLILGVTRDYDMQTTIENIVNINQFIEENILFFYNSYPDEVKNIFGDTFLFNGKTIDTLLTEYSDKCLDDSQIEKTDFKIMIDNPDGNPQIEEIKKNLFKSFFHKIPKGKRIINLAKYEDESLLSLFDMLYNLKINDNTRKIHYFSDSEMTKNDSPIFFSLIDKIRNSIMHYTFDVIEDDNGELFYSFQDTNVSDSNSDTNFILNYISSDDLKIFFETVEKILEQYGIAMEKVIAKENGKEEDIEREM